MKKYEKTKILVIGSGSIGTRHIENLSKIIEKVTVYSYRKKQLFKSSGNIELVRNLDDAINKSDGVIIANRTDKHVEVAMKAIKENKNLFIEKPISNSMKNINLLKEIGIKNKIIIETGFMLRFHPNLIKLKEFLNKNQFGEIHYARVSVGQYLPDWRPGVDYRQGYGAKKDWGGGVTLDLIHEIDLVCWLFGSVNKVSAMFRYSKKLEIETESVSQINLRMQSGVLVQINLDYLRPSYGRFTEIVTEKGVISWDYLSGNVIYEDSNKVKTILHKVDKDFTRNNMYMDEIKHFISSINGNNLLKASNIQDAEKAIRVAFSAHLSNKKNKFINPNEIKEDFFVN